MKVEFYGKEIETMNEVKIEFGKAGYIYYQTDEDTAVWAVGEALNCMKNNGINVDNLHPTEAVLRDANGNDIDSVSY